ncbi:uncharacterized protein LOC113491696 [Trichoplusia ni]|uniref:Uncharacterized protein LOC113491696 n=1 Tax=Trichoplusia ni TaxID=7111 RepID=A0A2H4WW92_TRINI|nr:uncharacterized protein LOC113491696 [Trichoplusia ni]AUD12124.1 hypothetical protein [Trichoplusia ni]
MTMLCACVVFCVSFGFIQTVPITYNEPYEVNEDYLNSDYNAIVRAARNLMLNPASESLLPLGDASHLEDTGIFQHNDVIRLPTVPTVPSGDFFVMPQIPYIDDRNVLPYVLNADNLQSWRNQYLQTPYIDQPNYETGSMNLESSPYEVDLYPVVHTSLSAALNPVPAIHTLPPVYSTHIHETIPSLEERGDYDLDVLNPENSELSVPNLRISRSRTGDYMDELRHEAIMSNILPTMPVPYVRGTEHYELPQREHFQRPLIGVYPNGAANDCALPLLFNCSPGVVRGTMSDAYPDYVRSGLSETSYRQRRYNPENKHPIKRDSNKLMSILL